MNDSLLSAIKAHDFTAIRNICLALSGGERQELKSYLARKNFNFIFREVLEKGSSEKESLLYKRFRGQDPTPDALIRRAFGE